MPLSEAFVWLAVAALLIGLFTGGVITMIVMAIEVVSDDWRRFKEWLRPGPKPPRLRASA